MTRHPFGSYGTTSPQGEALERTTKDTWELIP